MNRNINKEIKFKYQKNQDQLMIVDMVILMMLQVSFNIIFNNSEIY